MIATMSICIAEISEMLTPETPIESIAQVVILICTI